MRQRSRHTHAQVQLRSYKAFRRVAAPPPAAQRFLSSLHPDRREFLLTHGILLVQLPTSRAPRNTLTWIVPPEDGALVEAHWYTDGSLLDGQVAATTAFSTVGFGVLAVDERNVVVAAGYGTPPPWISTIPGVEAWAIRVALQHSLSARSITTDCLSIVASSGNAATLAKNASCPLARVWAFLAGPLEDLQTPLIWCPAHLSLREAHTRTKSNGSTMTFKDWRANRLVDALAKKGAELRRFPDIVRSQANAAFAATLHALALLGVVTRCANRHQVTGQDGRVTSLRDSRPTPWHARYVGHGAPHGEQSSTSTGTSFACPPPPHRPPHLLVSYCLFCLLKSAIAPPSAPLAPTISSVVVVQPTPKLRGRSRGLTSRYAGNYAS